MTNLRAELTNHLALKERLLAAYPDLSEDDPALLDTLSGETNLEEAIIALVKSAEDDRTLVAALDIRMDELRQRQERIETRAHKKREIVAEAMAAAGLKKITAPEATISLAAGSAKVVITDEAQIPSDYWQEKVTRSVDKTALKEAIKGGASIPGCVLSNAAPHLTIRRA